MSVSKIFNNTFFKIACVFAIIATVGLLFAGCGLSRLGDGPSQDDMVTGNGSLAVTKGDYLYFVNGYKSIDDIGDTNHYGKVEQAAIYRVKLDGEGKVIDDTQNGNTGNTRFSKTNEPKNVDIIAPKVAGFEYTKLYIFGDYLYYATPNHLRDKSGTIMSKYINIYRVRLDRAGSNDLIYSSDSENTSFSWTMHQIGDVAYMTILDGEKLVVVGHNTKGSDFTQNVVAEEHVSSSSMPTYSRSTDVVSDIDKKIYFTVEDHDDSTTTVLKSYDLVENKASDVYTSKGESYEVKGTNGDYLYYVKTVTGANAKIFANNFVDDEIEVSAQAYGSSADIRSFAMTGKKYETSILYSDGTNSYYKIAGQTAVKFLASDIISKIVKVEGNFVYYLSDSSLYRVDFTKADQTGTAMIPSGVTAKGDIVNNFSVDGDKIYFFVKYTNNYYLHYANYGATTSEIDQSVYTHFVGKLLEEDYVSEE